ncbi:hypothetical protein ONR75_25205 [Rhodopseudomonas sp. P2A-2r]|nr:hypothetical protein [Rhodopseudomonas sp. P2A-2r]UZE48111.1 hypothetical protein ONR75_25205 [Rhodopseudomonas sp. P2A-2r]
MFVQDSPFRHVLVEELDIDETCIVEMALQRGAAIHAHFQRRAWAAMKHQVFMKSMPAIPAAVDHYKVIVKPNDLEIVQFREMLSGLFFVGERNGQDQHAAGLEDVERMLKSDLCRRWHVLEDLGGNQEVAARIAIAHRLANVEERLLVIVGVGIVEFVGQRHGVAVPIGKPDAGDLWAHRKVRQRHRPAEQAEAEQMNNAAEAD